MNTDAKMSIWDWYAAMALAGLNANTDMSAQSASDIAEWAAQSADFLLEERKKRVRGKETEL